MGLMPNFFVRTMPRGYETRVANDAVMMKSAVPAPAVSAGESTLTMRVGMEVRILPK